jgi:hypothetical protein
VEQGALQLGDPFQRGARRRPVDVLDPRPRLDHGADLVRQVQERAAPLGCAVIGHESGLMALMVSWSSVLPACTAARAELMSVLGPIEAQIGRSASIPGRG